MAIISLINWYEANLGPIVTHVDMLADPLCRGEKTGSGQEPHRRPIVGGSSRGGHDPGRPPNTTQSRHRGRWGPTAVRYRR